MEFAAVHDVDQIDGEIVEWDAESLTLRVSILASRDQLRNKSQVQQDIESAVGVRVPEYNLAIDQLVLTADEDRFFRGFSIRTNSEFWDRRNLEPIENARAGAIRLPAIFDENGLASIEAEIHVVYDDQRGCLALQIEPLQEIKEWVKVATSVYIALSPDGHIAELRIGNIDRVAP